MKKEITELSKRLDDCIDEYTELFCNKHDIDFEGWIGDKKGEIGCFADMYLHFSDIKMDIDEDAPEKYIFDWYWENHEEAINDSGLFIGYESYIMGLRMKDLKKEKKKNQKTRLKKLVSEAQQNDFNAIIKELKDNS